MSVGLLVVLILNPTQRERARVATVEWSAPLRAMVPGPALPGVPAALRGVTAYVSAWAPRTKGTITLGLRN